MRVAAKIRRYRVQRGISQRALGKLVGVSQKTIADWECGKSERMLAANERLFTLLIRNPFAQLDFEQGVPEIRSQPPEIRQKIA